MGSKWVGFFYSRLGFFTYSWFLLLTDNWLGLFGLVFLLTVENRLCIFYLQLKFVRKLDFGIFCLWFPHRKEARETNRKQQDPNCELKRRICSKQNSLDILTGGSKRVTASKQNIYKKKPRKNWACLIDFILFKAQLGEQFQEILTFSQVSLLSRRKIGASEGKTGIGTPKPALEKQAVEKWLQDISRTRSQKIIHIDQKCCNMLMFSKDRHIR